MTEFIREAALLIAAEDVLRQIKVTEVSGDVQNLELLKRLQLCECNR